MSLIDVVALLLGYGIVIGLLLWLSIDAEKQGIYLSKSVKVLFLLTGTMPFVLIWYVIKRHQSRKAKTREEISQRKSL